MLFNLAAAEYEKMESGIGGLIERVADLETRELRGKLGRVVAKIEDFESAHGSADIYAGAVALVYDDIVKSLRNTYKDVGGKNDTGPSVNGRSVPRILKAVGNNFRHYEEWSQYPPDNARVRDQQLDNARTIATLLECPFPDDTVVSALGHIVAWRAIYKLGGGTFAGLERIIQKTLYAMVEDLGLTENHHVKSVAKYQGLPD
jgi:hypothetical protein